MNATNSTVRDINVMKPFHYIHEIELANTRRGHHFFEPAAKRFFRSRIIDDVTPDPTGDGGFFITSEQFVGPTGKALPRAYTVRHSNSEGWITTVGGFNTIPTLRAARKAVAAAVEEKKAAIR